MTTASTSLLGLALPVTGELSGTWGDVVNNSITNLLDSAIAGTTTLSADADVTLTTTTLSANQAREAIILWTANGTTTRNITAPAQSKIYTVINASAGTQSIVLRGAGPTTGVTIIKGESALCAWNGSDFIKISTSAGNGTFSTVTATAATTASSNLGAYRYGTLSFSDTGIVQSMQTSVNSYFQNVIQNTSAGTAASAEFIAYNDQGTASTNYATVGINSSGYSGTGSINAPGYGYFLSASTDLVLGTIGANAIHFTTNSSATDALAISSAGAVSLPGGTANGVAYLNGSKVVTTGSALTFDGATLGVNGVSVGRGAGAVSTNTAVGASALATNSTGAQNTAIGINALKLATDSLNTAVGTNSLQTQSTGYRNTAVGAQSYPVLTTGIDNVAVGTYAGNAMTTGSTNTAIGASALYSNTTASNNTAVGYQSLYTNTGANNTAVGWQSGYNNTTASYLTAIGYKAALSNTTGSETTAIGYEALRQNTTGNYNSAVGVGALFANTTGSSNTALGDSALQANTTASNNTAVGYQAGYTNTTGNLNTFVGRQVAFLNTTGSSLVAVGQSALYSNTTGSSNVAIGDNALAYNTTASNNTAVGYQAGYYNTTGTRHTIVGFQAGYANTTGNYLAAFGDEALYSNTTGNYNTAVGGPDSGLWPVLYSNTTGSYNTGIGNGALAKNTTASNNTAVGYQAGYSNTTGYNSVILGTLAGYTNSTGVSNLYLGYKAGYLATGNSNTFVGAQNAANNSGCGDQITTGSKNTIIGSYNGNQGGLDIRTASNYIVLSDGDGNPNGYFNATNWYFPSVDTQTTGSAANVNVGTGGVLRKSTSSLKYKRDVQDATHGLAELLQLRSVTYKSKASLDGDTVYGGLIAEEVEAAGLSEFVMYAPDGTPDALAYGNMVSLCVKAIQEQQALIESLTKRLADAGIA